MSYTISQIAALLGLEYQGNGGHALNRVANAAAADGECLVFLEKSAGLVLPDSLQAAGCIIAAKATIPAGCNAIFSDHPKLDFSRAAALLHPFRASSGIVHSTAQVDPAAEIGTKVELGPFAVVGANARIGDECILQAGVVVGEGCRIGRKCIFYPGVILYPGAQVGDNVILHAGVVIGADGFGYVSDGRSYTKFPQTGAVIIDDDVEIGCNTCIDRGSLGTTRIGAGTKIDNLVQIGHNVEIGKHVVIASQTGVSGSTIIEDSAIIGGQVGFGDHARVQSGAIIGSKAGVLPGKIVRGGETYWGVPVRPLREYKRLNALFGRLPDMKLEIESLRKEVDELKRLAIK